jgi:hypothetical protein
MIKIINQNKGTIIFTLKGRTLCEHIHFFSSEESEDMNLFEPIDEVGEWFREREGYEYSELLKYPSYEELCESQVITLLEQMHKDHEEYGFATLSDMIDEQFICYQDELKRISFTRDVLKCLEKLIAA